jgi:hypothetical protein
MPCEDGVLSVRRFETKERRMQAAGCERAFEDPFGTHVLHPHIWDFQAGWNFYETRLRGQAVGRLRGPSVGASRFGADRASRCAPKLGPKSLPNRSLVGTIELLDLYSFIAEANNRVEIRRAVRRIISKKQSHSDRNRKTQDDPQRRNKRRNRGQGRSHSECD